MLDARTLSGAALATALRKSRSITLACVADLSDEQWRVPELPQLNPIAWELAHLAWFAEFWVLRGPHHAGADGLMHAERPARIAGPDELFDSSRLPHAERWKVELPPRERVMDMLQRQLDACIEALPDGSDDRALYFHRLVLLHEDMHGEALTGMRALLGYPPPHHPAWHHVALPRFDAHPPLRIEAGRRPIGWPPGQHGFAFDNEMPTREVTLPTFEIDVAPLRAGQFLDFVEAGGYDNPAYWPGAAGDWRRRSGLHHPARWRGEGDEWEHRFFDRWLPLDPDQFAVHLNAWEAEAYCLWAGRRLPTAAEWEFAGRSTPAFLWGRSVWEWTADDFLPYPGFIAGPYRDYSQPWFGSHRELRGGSFATHVRVHARCYRNFALPERTDIFAGFRTVALSPAQGALPPSSATEDASPPFFCNLVPPLQ